MQSEQELEGFRAELRDWLEANCPAEMRGGEPSEASICWGGKNFEFESDAQRVWMERAASKGYTVPTWPVEYGGAGMNRAQEKIFKEEMDRIEARNPLQSFGIWMLGPALLHFGTHEQKLHYLPRSPAVKSAGVRAIPSRGPGRIWPVSRPKARTRAIIGW